MVPVLIGWVINDFATLHDATGNISGYDYTIPMSIFAIFGICAIMIAFLLKREDKIKSYGLEQPNIKR